MSIDSPFRKVHFALPASPATMLVWRALVMGVATSALSGCVTINIYFPAAAAEKAADRIIEEVYQLRKDAPAAKPADSK
jgi:hypothetical protein